MSKRKPKALSADGARVRPKACTLPVLSEKCGTCPFREGSPYAHLAPDLAMSALTNASRVCHSTGCNNGINRRTGKRPALCRGARDVQIAYFHNSGFIDAPTDEAWYRKLAELRGEPQPCQS